MDQEAPAVRRRQNVLYEETTHAAIAIGVCQREIEGSLDLSAELPGSAFRVPVGRPAAAILAEESIGEIQIGGLVRLRTGLMLFQKKIPYLRIRAPRLTDTKYVRLCQPVMWNTMGVSLKRPAQLGGGRQARRHRRMCNREHVASGIPASNSRPDSLMSGSGLYQYRVIAAADSTSCTNK